MATVHLKDWESSQLIIQIIQGYKFPGRSIALESLAKGNIPRVGN
jgi:hypothetical protein